MAWLSSLLMTGQLESEQIRLGFDNRSRVIPLCRVPSPVGLNHNFVSMTEGWKRTTVFGEVFHGFDITLSECVFFQFPWLPPLSQHLQVVEAHTSFWRKGRVSRKGRPKRIWAGDSLQPTSGVLRWVLGKQCPHHTIIVEFAVHYKPLSCLDREFCPTVGGWVVGRGLPMPDAHLFRKAFVSPVVNSGPPSLDVGSTPSCPSQSSNPSTSCSSWAREAASYYQPKRVSSRFDKNLMQGQR